MMILAVIVGVASTWIGLLLSAWLDIASGATIVLVATIVFFLCTAFSPHRRTMKQRVRGLRKDITKQELV